jgi:CHAT domain-containing protein
MIARQRLADVERRLAQSSDWLRVHFPEYAELSRPLAVSASETGKLLRDDEALVLFSLTTANCFVWVVTPGKIHWVRLDVPLQSLIDMVVALRQQLAGGRFNLNLAYGVYRAVFGPIEEQIAGKHLLIVPNGILTSLPLHLLVTNKPEPTDEVLSERYRHASWMIKRHAITMLPSVSALKALRQRSVSSDATRPYLGIGNPLLEGRNKDDRRAWIFKRCSDLKSSPPVVLASTSASPDGGVSAVFRGGQADIDEIRRLEPLPETVAELCAVAESLGSGDDAVFLGSEASETNIRRLSRDHVLSNARVVHFATHGLVAGEMHGLAEPALVVSPPSDEKGEASSENDGLLTASEIAQLDFNADWVVLSACNTAAGNIAGAEALSGLARAFFYAGTRALLVSHWMVNTDAAVKLMVGTFAILGRDPHIGRAEALRRAMIEMIEGGAAHETHPRYWAPFVIVGEGSAQ